MAVLKFFIKNPWVIVLILLTAAGYGAWWYWDYSQTRIVDLAVSVESKNAVIAERDKELDRKREEIRFMNEQAEQQRALLRQHDAEIAEIRQQNDLLVKELSQVDLPKLANQDAQKLQDTINKRTQQMLKEFESISRSQ